MNEPWRIQLFGALRARQGERLITRFRTQQTGALLAYLTYHLHQSHSREALVEFLWPDGEIETGRHNLSNALSSLRNQLEPPGVLAGTVIIADRFSVELNSDAVTTDVAEFEQALRRAAQSRNDPKYTQLLADAAEKYGGLLLPHYYDEWIAPEQERLQQRFHQTISRLIGLLEKEGAFERALEYAQRSLSLDPLREESHCDAPAGGFRSTGGGPSPLPRNGTALHGGDRSSALVRGPAALPEDRIAVGDRPGCGYPLSSTRASARPP
jgi:DNA-binding SARP family transcriptional activator